MKVFITGGTGFVGTAVIKHLIAHGHDVLALARSDRSAQRVRDLGATPFAGSLTDTDRLRLGALQSDAVLHLAYNNNMRQARQAAQTDRNAITAMADALVGTNRPFIMASGVTGIFGKHQSGNELETPATNFITGMRVRSEKLALSYVPRGVKAMVIRLAPFVHGPNDHGFTSRYVQAAQRYQSAMYIGSGRNTWPAVHRDDAASLFVAALEKGQAGAIYHAVAEGTTAKSIAITVSQHLDLPLTRINMLTGLHRLGILAYIFTLDTPANSTWTQQHLGWHPTHPSLINDINAGTYDN